MSLTAGTQFGPYEIVAPLGAGGMGEVYRARDSRLERDVAIKVLPEALVSDAEALSRFEREAKAVAALSHPNILAIHDFGSQGGVAYAVMELLEGETLRERLDAGPMPRRKALDYALQITQGLAAAHDRGIIHRDLKPQNVFLTRDRSTRKGPDEGGDDSRHGRIHVPRTGPRRRRGPPLRHLFPGRAALRDADG